MQILNLQYESYTISAVCCYREKYKTTFKDNAKTKYTARYKIVWITNT